MSPLVFVVLAALTLGAAVAVVLNRNPVYSALALVSTLALLSCFFVGLEAYLVWALQLVVYAGAIVVLFLFVIMLLNVQREESVLPAPGVVAGVGVGAGLLALGVAHAVTRAPAVAMPAVAEGYGSPAHLARRLFTDYLVPFEITSVLLLVAIVGAVVLGKRRI
ncbi:MAG TPA: NADH-quinone oxidoreductase subunit J [Candidatus Limnocylindria bacterium]|nr:NADH-quinone oxidoreductase subunit J [Candidatus Limnocylindria bacterium]